MNGIMEFYEFRHNWAFSCNGSIISRPDGAARFIDVRSRHVIEGAPTQVEIDGKQFECGVGYDLKVCRPDDQYAWSTFIIITPKIGEHANDYIVFGKKLIDEFELDDVFDEDDDVNTVFLEIDFC